MQKLFTSLLGITLVAIGALALVGDLLLSALGVPLLWWQFWRMWPLVVMAMGLAFVLPPILMPQHRGLGALFIPGLPILTTGGILLFNSLFDSWNSWALLWPLEILSLALAFMLTGIFTRVVWFGIPAMLIGLNGLVLAFCNVTGLWGSWAVLWSVEPLAVGLCLLLAALATRSPVLGIVGAVFCGFASLAFIGMSTLLLFGGRFLQLAGPLLVIGVGFILLVIGLIPRQPTAARLS